MDGIVTMVQDSIPKSIQHVGKFGDGSMFQRPSQSTPFVEGFRRPGAGTIRPDVFQFVLENQNAVKDLVQFQKLLQLAAFLFTANVRTVFQ